ncbi:MAG: ParB/RepB/Spo0J family partition protein [Angelakisella sp.]
MFERRPRVKGRILMLPVADIAPSPWQPRRVFDDAELDSLARSIAQNGLLVPIAVRSTPEGYLLIAGERRLMACKRIGLS